MQGANVVDVGLVTTPMLYHISGSTDAEVAVMITASHLGSDFNGLKICIEDAVPIGLDSGLREVREYIEKGTFKEVETKGTVTHLDPTPLWYKQVSDLSDQKDEAGEIKIVVDPANAVGIIEIATLKTCGKNLCVESIFDTFDHTAPNHEANPLKHETLTDLGRTVTEFKADFGVAFDGDADRIGVVDENGVPVPQDILGIIFAEDLLRRKQGGAVVHDIRSTKRVREVIEALGGIPVPERVGHTYIRRKMREHNAVLGVELSGHYFFGDMYYSEGGARAVLLLVEILRNSGKKLSELVSAHAVYAHSGEINSVITRTPEEIYADIKSKYPDAQFHTKDGLSVECDDWWCNIRPSATDPVLRLNLEANNHKLRDELVTEVLELIRRK
jgi:phosphomannomutase